jgi:hypothetical protein
MVRSLGGGSEQDFRLLISPQIKKVKLKTIFKMTRCLSYLVFLLFVSFVSTAQNTRMRNDNKIGWYNYFGTFKLNSKFGYCIFNLWQTKIDDFR